MVEGNITGLKKSILNRLEELYNLDIDKEEFVNPELIKELADITAVTNREFAVYINRRGIIESISAGDFQSVQLKGLNLRRGLNRLSGIRCIHTHPSGTPNLSEVDIQTLQKEKFDAMVAIGVTSDGRTNGAEVGILSTKQGEYTLNMYRSLDALYTKDLLLEIKKRDSSIGKREATIKVENEKERVILVGLKKSSVDELGELALTKGLIVIEKMVQHRAQPDKATYIGHGKSVELARTISAKKIGMVICDDELTASQTTRLEKITGKTVIDRTTLILSIFADHAKSKVGKIQVELAQLKYLLPRLVGLGHELSRQGGATGGGYRTRGPGEKMLETDKRHLIKRIKDIETELKRDKKHRGALRENRRKAGVFVVSLAGYTNAGKSSLLNKLCNDLQYAEDQLFATLDTVSRKLVLDDGLSILLVDTVGFIDKLPHNLVQAFHSTLEEIVEADLVLHVTDVSSEERESHIKVVNNVLNDLGATQTRLMVYNKSDLIGEDFTITVPNDGVLVSAKTGEGLDKLKELIIENLPEFRKKVKMLIPYKEASLLSKIKGSSKILSEDYKEEGVLMEAEIEDWLLGRINKEYIVY